jgi:hypothetical protein
VRVVALADALPAALLSTRDGASRVRRARAAAAAAAAAALGGAPSASAAISRLEAVAAADALSTRPLAAAEAGALWRELVPAESEVERRARAGEGGAGGGAASGAAAAEERLRGALELVRSFEAHQIEGGWLAAPSAKGGACLLRPVSS